MARLGDRFTYCPYSGPFVWHRFAGWYGGLESIRARGLCGAELHESVAVFATADAPRIDPKRKACAKCERRAVREGVAGGDNV